MKIQQFHKSVTAARKQITKWRNDPHSSFGRDYNDYTVTKIRLAAGKNERTPTGRRLYDITLRRKK